jgi:LmbE family N-acetylglucosaminyl deacetylase
MLGLVPGGVREVVALAAHPDDLEIAAGGTLLTMASANPGLRVHYLLFTGTAQRQAEARTAAAAFLPGARISFALHQLPDGRLPARWAEVKELLEAAAAEHTPDLVLAPARDDAHQDHRTVAELVPTAFRDALMLHYEIPKWDGDLGRPNVYVPLADATAQRKVELLHDCYPSQKSRDWWDDEVFLGLARLRGMECRSRYAEAFQCHKAVLQFGALTTP